MTLIRDAWLSAVLLPLGFGASAAQPRLGASSPIVCASGYHADAGGDCQPEAAQVDRYCAPGWVFHPEFDGWRCDPPPREAD